MVVMGQDKEYARQIIDTLASESMHGRGYVNNGDRIAAEYISNDFRNMGLKSFGENYFQSFNISVNTFPDTVEARIDSVDLIPGKDFVIFSSSPSIGGTYELAWQMADSSGKLSDSARIKMKDLTSKVVVTDLNQKEFEKQNVFGSKGVILLMENKVWWHASNGTKVQNYFQMQVVRDKIPGTARTVSVHAHSLFLDQYTTQNVVGYIEGKSKPDIFFVFTAHYDHLGQMGSETWFPGANDNASGTAMLLDLAKFYSLPENRPEVSIAFLSFSGEEVGLVGSEYFVENPLFPIEKIKFLINLDMVGSGSEGIKVVNGTVFKKEFEKLVEINAENEYILTVSERGEAANSDHFPFYAKGVPCFFIYTLGKECKEYHNIYDTPENVPLTEYNDVFRLLVDFESLMEKP
jgi:aminopeptidase YwaD